MKRRPLKAENRAVHIRGGQLLSTGKLKKSLFVSYKPLKLKFRVFLICSTVVMRKSNVTKMTTIFITNDWALV